MPAPTNPKKKSLMPSSPLRKTLRGAGHHLSVIVQVGKEGVTDAVLRQLSEALDHHELVKLKVGTESPEDRFEVAEALAERADAQVAQVLGRTVLVYRRHPEHPRYESLPVSRSRASWIDSERAEAPGLARTAPMSAAPVKRAPAPRASRAGSSSGSVGSGARRGATKGAPAKRGASSGARGAGGWKRGPAAGKGSPKRGPAAAKRGTGPSRRTSAGKPGTRRVTAKPRSPRSPARKRS